MLPVFTSLNYSISKQIFWVILWIYFSKIWRMKINMIIVFDNESFLYLNIFFMNKEFLKNEVPTQKSEVMSQSAAAGEDWDELSQEVQKVILSIRTIVRSLYDNYPNLDLLPHERIWNLVILENGHIEQRLLAYLPEGKKNDAENIIMVDVDYLTIIPLLPITQEDRENNQWVNNILTCFEVEKKEQEELDEKQRIESLKHEIYDELDGETSDSENEGSFALTQSARESIVKKFPTWEFCIISVYTNGRKLEDIHVDTFK